MIAHERPDVALAFEDHGGTTGVVPHLRVSWNAYWDLVDELVVKVARDGTWQPNQIVAITFGGIIPARAISEALGGVPIAYFAAESYRPAHVGDGRRMEQAQLAFARDLLKTSPAFGNRTLVVDDLADTGRTASKCVQWLHRHPTYGMDLSCRIAFLWRKTHATFGLQSELPVIAVDEVKRVDVPERAERLFPWIDQPMEAAYSIATIGDIERRLRSRDVADEPH